MGHNFSELNKKEAIKWYLRAGSGRWQASVRAYALSRAGDVLREIGENYGAYKCYFAAVTLDSEINIPEYKDLLISMEEKAEAEHEVYSWFKAGGREILRCDR